MKRLVVACQSEGCESRAKYSVVVEGGRDYEEYLWCSRCTRIYFNPKGFGAWVVLNKTHVDPGRTIRVLTINCGDPIYMVSIKKFKQPENKR